PVLAKSPKAVIDEAVLVLEEMFDQKDAAACGYLLKRAKGVAVFPSVIKAGLMLGGRYGEGLLLKRDDKGNWYGPYFVTIKGVSYGLQIGVQSAALLMVITNERGMESFTGDKVTLGGEVGVAAGPLGRQAAAATDLDLEASIYSYSMTKGAFAGMSMEGSVIEPDEEANESYWGKVLTPAEILSTRAKDARIAELLAEIEGLMDKGD
ncbi:MAG: lipid-binding SYLF domain-containing protein, partial [Firmicutes bacterium]|nr:lipid-binding SYLF domain-containing protein [Bacillota bacterium]